MRFLIAFLLCYIIQFQDAQARGLTSAAPQKFQSHSTRSLQTIKGASPLKPCDAFSKDFMEERCAIHQQNHPRISLNWDFPAGLNIPDSQATDLHWEKLSPLRKFNYTFPFHILYPNHAFW